MTLAEFVPALARQLEDADRTLRIDQDLLEQDVRLHLLLRDLVADRQVGPQLVFKGGTCLIKCYAHYPRFSVDLDFTWLDQGRWKGRGNEEDA